MQKISHNLSGKMCNMLNVNVVVKLVEKKFDLRDWKSFKKTDKWNTLTHNVCKWIYKHSFELKTLRTSKI